MVAVLGIPDKIAGSGLIFGGIFFILVGLIGLIAAIFGKKEEKLSGFFFSLWAIVSLGIGLIIGGIGMRKDDLFLFVIGASLFFGLGLIGLVLLRKIFPKIAETIDRATYDERYFEWLEEKKRKKQQKSTT